jgi:pilus assembly protein CpaF
MNGFEPILPFLRPIQHLILDPEISEIMVNGPDRIFLEKAGYLQAVPDMRLTAESLIVAIKNIARRLGDDISEEKPILDSRLPDGSRVAAVIPPCSIHGVALTIRKFNSHKFGMEDLIQAGTVTVALANQLNEFVLHRKNILICGATAVHDSPPVSCRAGLKSLCSHQNKYCRIFGRNRSDRPPAWSAIRCGILDAAWV